MNKKYPSERYCFGMTKVTWFMIRISTGNDPLKYSFFFNFQNHTDKPDFFYVFFGGGSEIL